MKVPLLVRVMPHLAERAWFTPPPLSPRRESRWAESINGTDPIVVNVGGVDLTGYTRGEGPSVFLVHGWGGRASQMGRLARTISERGFKVVAVDAPGHGDGQKTSDVFQMTQAVEALIDQFGHPAAVVAHSLGSMATLRAFRGRVPASVVLLAPVLDVNVALEKFIERAQLMPWTARSLVGRIRKFIGPEWDSFVEGYRTDFGNARLLLVHDPEDGDAPFEQSAALAATRAETDLWVSDSSGHTGGLQAAEVLERVADFLVAATTASRSRAE